MDFQKICIFLIDPFSLVFLRICSLSLSPKSFVRKRQAKDINPFFEIFKDLVCEGVIVDIVLINPSLRFSRILSVMFLKIPGM